MFMDIYLEYPQILGHSAGCPKVSKTIASIPPIFVVKKGIMVMFQNLDVSDI